MDYLWPRDRVTADDMLFALVVSVLVTIRPGDDLVDAMFNALVEATNRVIVHLEHRPLDPQTRSRRRARLGGRMMPDEILEALAYAEPYQFLAEVEFLIERVLEQGFADDYERLALELLQLIFEHSHAAKELTAKKRVPFEWLVIQARDETRGVGDEVDRSPPVQREVAQPISCHGPPPDTVRDSGSDAGAAMKAA